MAQPASLGLLDADAARPARGYERYPDKWEEGPWYDRKTGQPIRVTVASPDADPERLANLLVSGVVRVQTLADVLARFRLHPEHKSLGHDDQWAHEGTVGQLQRRPVQSAPVLTDLTGKGGEQDHRAPHRRGGQSSGLSDRLQSSRGSMADADRARACRDARRAGHYRARCSGRRTSSKPGEGAVEDCSTSRIHSGEVSGCRTKVVCCRAIKIRFEHRPVARRNDLVLQGNGHSRVKQGLRRLRTARDRSTGPLLRPNMQEAGLSRSNSHQGDQREPR